MWKSQKFPELFALVQLSPVHSELVHKEQVQCLFDGTHNRKFQILGEHITPL